MISGRSDWEGDGKHVYFNDEHKELIEQKKQHLLENYEGIGDYLLVKLREEEVMSPEEKIKQIENDVEELQKKKQQYKQIVNERKRENQLQDKKELLRSKQEKLDELRDEGVRSFHEVMMDEIQMREKSGHDCSNPDIARMVLDRAKRKMDKQPDVKELVKDVERLQDEVAELNGGREDWFLQLEAVEVSA